MGKIIKVDEPNDDFVIICRACDKQLLLYSGEEVFGTGESGEDLALMFITSKCPECDKVVWVLQI